ncbi:MAG: peroxiredoxin family protein [Prevotellaceae bacterium]|jgi:peroxiredoxin|nr:peroxiredoxin family protein [Prevotellaceae bacterium]
MKRIIKILLPVIIFVALAYAGYYIMKISYNKKIREERVSHLPAFTLKTLQGNYFTNTDLKQNEPVIFFYFSSECDICQMETEDILSNIEKFADIQIIFVSIEPIQEIILYQKKYKLDMYDNVTLLNDYKCEFPNSFGVTNLPSSLVYSKNGILLYRSNSAIKVDYLLSKIKKISNE